MYLAQEYNDKGELRFFIRETVEDSSGNLVPRQLFDLGRDPAQFLQYIDDRIFFISSEVEDALSRHEVKYEYDELEELFWPFVDVEVKATIESFCGRRVRHSGKRLRRKRRMAHDLFNQTHIFDRRRLYYLKFVQIDMGDAVETPLPIYEILVGKCRDEIENRIAFMELELRPWEMRGYLYAIFDVASGFAPKLTRFVPDAQDIELIDKYFMEEICRLNCDSALLGQEVKDKDSACLHPYLRKYLFMFFDTYFSNRGNWKQRGRTDQTSREWTPPAPPQSSDHMQAMGLTEAQFQEMDQHEFTRYFRKKAQELHPDKGGDHETFVAFINAYQILLMRKKW